MEKNKNDTVAKHLKQIKTSITSLPRFPFAEGTHSQCFKVQQANCMVVLKAKYTGLDNGEKRAKNKKIIANIHAIRPHLERLRAGGVHVPRYFGCFMDKNEILYVVQLKMPGEAMLPNPYGHEITSTRTADRLDKLLNAPEEHFAKFVRDAKAIIEEGIALDFFSAGNFLYDEHYGFSFIDVDKLNSSSDTTNLPHFLIDTFAHSYDCEIHGKAVAQKYQKVFLRFVKAFDDAGFSETRKVGKWNCFPHQEKFWQETQMQEAINQMFKGKAITI